MQPAIDLGEPARPRRSTGRVADVAGLRLGPRASQRSEAKTAVDGNPAFGLAIVSRDRSLARDLQRFLYGDILTIRDGQILCLLVLFLAMMAFQAASYNHLLYIGLNPTLAQAHHVRVAIHQYIFAGLLSLIVMFSVQAVGVLGGRV